jgi:hypothetical protein
MDEIGDCLTEAGRPSTKFASLRLTAHSRGIKAETVAIDLGQSKFWENDRFELKVKKQISVSMKLSPDWKAIGKYVLGKLVTNGVIAASEIASPTGAAASTAGLASGPP